MPRTSYIQHGHRKWIKRVYQDQCDVEVDLFGRRCQGVEGHSGPHWCCNESGWLVLRPNLEEEPDADWALSSIPPGHKDYISPEEKQAEYYLKFNQTSEVTDQKLIDQLENDEFIGEDVTIDRIVTEEDMDKPFGEDGKTLRELIEERK